VLASGGSSEGVAAINYACVEVAKGTPYVWGGGHGPTPGPTGGGLDCSGLARYAYAQAVGGDPIGEGSTSTEWAELGGQRFSGAQGTGPLRPGDLLYWTNNGAASGIHHVAIYLGANQVVEEPETGETARVVPFWSSGYYGAIRLYADSYAKGPGAKFNGGIDDVSGDGHADLVWSDGQNVNYLGNNTSTNPGHVPFFGNSAPVVKGLPADALVAAGSVTGHDTADLFVYDPNKDQVRLYPGGGGATPYSGIGYVVASTFGPGVTKIFAADLTGDGFDELVWTKSDGTAWYLPNNMGAHTDGLPFSGENGIEIAHGLPADATVAFGNFSNDHFADMLYVSGGNLFYLPNNIESQGGGVQPFPENSTQLTTNGSFAGVNQMTGADVSGDGAADLLWADASGNVYYLPNNSGTNPDGAFFDGPSTQVASLGQDHTLI
jgi:hypothetical protein